MFFSDKKSIFAYDKQHSAIWKQAFIAFVCAIFALRINKKEISIRCSLENFGEFVSPKGKKIIVNPLYAISNLF